MCHSTANQYLGDTISQATLIKRFESAFQKANITLFTPSDPNEQMSLLARVKKSRLNRNDLARVLENADEFKASIRDLKRNQQRKERNEPTAEDVWNAFIPLLAIAVQDEPKKMGFTNEAEWLKQAKSFGEKYVSRYGSEEVTPYMHVFIYHLGFYMERYGGIERFANYASESKHQENKKAIRRGTSGFEGSHKTKETRLGAQLLKRDIRMKLLQKYNVVKKPRRRRKAKGEKAKWAANLWKNFRSSSN